MSDYGALVALLSEACPGCDVRENVPLAEHTSLGIGGPADILVRVHTQDQLRESVTIARRQQVPVLILGGGSNVLVADAGLRGIAIINGADEFAIDDDGILVVQSGAPFSDLACWTASQGWQGLEWAAGIPGTIGGAIVGNAGAYAGCMADSVQSVQVLTTDGVDTTLSAQDLDYGYRVSALKLMDWNQRPTVLSARLQLRRGDAAELVATTETIRATRSQRIPEGRSAGSMFKRTIQFPAGFLIEQAGLKGYRIGGAQVSGKHANFLMNAQNATASDMYALVQKVQREVWSRFAQKLESEVERVGEWS